MNTAHAVCEILCPLPARTDDNLPLTFEEQALLEDLLRKIVATECSGLKTTDEENFR